MQSLPKLTSMNAFDDTMEFTLENIEMSFANALRRTILSDVPVYCFMTYPEKENQCTIDVNTSRFNNEIIKQRLSCIPVHIKDSDFPLETYELIVEKENTSSNIMYVTTEDFQIRNVVNDKYLSDDSVRKIFPAHKKTKQFIDFIRLRPKISDEIPGEQISLRAKFSRANAKVDGMFNVVSTCSYGQTMDHVQVDKVWSAKEKEMRNKQMDELDIANEKKNFMLLDAERITKTNSYDFIIETVGIYENAELVKHACLILQTKFQHLKTMLQEDEVKIQESQTTMEHCFDVKLTNEDYTIGKCVEYMMHAKYITQENVLTFCGFKKFHPHDDFSIIRLAYVEKVTMGEIKQHMSNSCDAIIEVFQHISNLF